MTGIAAGARRHAGAAAAVLATLATVYVAVQALGVAALEDPRLGNASPGTAAVGVGLLVADAVVPVGSSIVMLSLGALYGPVLGILLCVTGRVGMTAAGMAIGRRGRRWLDRNGGPAPQAAGSLSIALTRPIPLVAETVSIVAGAAGVGWARGLLAAAAGALPESIAYSLAGSLAQGTQSVVLIWCGLLAVAALAWAVAVHPPVALERRTRGRSGHVRGT